MSTLLFVADFTTYKLVTDITYKIFQINHWGKADDHNCNYGYLKMADMESGKNRFCRLNCFYNVF